LERVLWIDDNPSNNAYEVAQLETLGVNVTHVTSTRGGLAALSDSTAKIDAVISDMGREEPHGFNANAGIDLIRQLRDYGYAGPIFIYASRNTVERRAEIIAAGGTGVTASPTELFALLHAVAPFPATTDA
jgi:CheY-like chemotaxis protein